MESDIPANHRSWFSSRSLARRRTCPAYLGQSSQVYFPTEPIAILAVMQGSVRSTVPRVRDVGAFVFVLMYILLTRPGAVDGPFFPLTAYTSCVWLCCN